MITHYGLFWSERDVFWGRPAHQGQLLGRVPTQNEGPGAPRAEARVQQQDYRSYVGLYCLYGGGTLLYVGEAGLGTQSTLFERLKSHTRGSLAGRWDHFSWFGRQNCEGEVRIIDSLKQLEAISIAIINPGFNRQSGTFAHATQVYQVSHPDSQGDVETKLERLSELIRGLNRVG